MRRVSIISLKMMGVMVLLLGVIYPLCVTGIAQLFFPYQANGSLVNVSGKVKGSVWMGQYNTDSLYFHPRPSAISYDPMVSGASNLSLDSKVLRQQAEQRSMDFKSQNNFSNDVVVPSDMLFASASGLDPHISPEAARLQINRIVRARGFTTQQKEELTALVEHRIENPQFGLFGNSRVNVFMLNLALDNIK